MSTMIMSACWPMQMAPTPKAVLISLADNANDQGECWPSIPKICERTCFSERTVHAAIKWLEDAGLVVADRSNGRHTRYLVKPEAYKPPQELHPRSSRTPAAAAGEPPQISQQPPQISQQPPQISQQPPQIPQSPPQELRSNRKEPSRTIRKKRVTGATFDQWIQTIGDEDAIRADDPIYDWAEKAGIPERYLDLAWRAFDDRFTEAEKTYTNWRATFRNYVRNGWLNIWRPLRGGGYELTDIGLQWERVALAEAREAT